jgi:hypothetical protein
MRLQRGQPRRCLPVQPVLDVDYNWLATKLKVLLRSVPTKVKAAIAATAINAAISAYSIAVTPRLSVVSRAIFSCDGLQID